MAPKFPVEERKRWRPLASGALIGLIWSQLVPQQPRSAVGTVATIALLFIWTEA